MDTNVDMYTHKSTVLSLLGYTLLEIALIYLMLHMWMF